MSWGSRVGVLMGFEESNLEAMAFLFAFTQGLAELSLVDRKKRLARLMGRRRVGIVLSKHTDEDGAAIFQQACRMGLEGIVPKRGVRHG
jgi:ATP-dependent DNA ligase